MKINKILEENITIKSCGHGFLGKNTKQNQTEK